MSRIKLIAAFFLLVACVSYASGTEIYNSNGIRIERTFVDAGCVTVTHVGQSVYDIQLSNIAAPAAAI